LEDLLLKYPPEDVEAKRWQKIASALGNRSTAQVASRVQKYFIKLAKAGLPVPGRVPNMTAHNKKVGELVLCFSPKFEKDKTEMDTVIKGRVLQPPVNGK
jgi:hypothetical protein